MKELIELVKKNLQPEGRAIATARTLQEMWDVLPELGPNMLIDPLITLISTPKEGDTPPILARRKTLAEIQSLAKTLASNPIPAAPSLWEKWQKYCLKQVDIATDEGAKARYQAMADTAEREFNEMKDRVIKA